MVFMKIIWKIIIQFTELILFYFSALKDAVLLWFSRFRIIVYFSRNNFLFDPWCLGSLIQLNLYKSVIFSYATISFLILIIFIHILLQENISTLRVWCSWRICLSKIISKRSTSRIKRTRMKQTIFIAIIQKLIKIIPKKSFKDLLWIILKLVHYQ